MRLRDVEPDDVIIGRDGNHWRCVCKHRLVAIFERNGRRVPVELTSAPVRLVVTRTTPAESVAITNLRSARLATTKQWQGFHEAIRNWSDPGEVIDCGF